MDGWKNGLWELAMSDWLLTTAYRESNVYVDKLFLIHHNHICCVILFRFGHFASNWVRYIDKSEQKLPPFQKCWWWKLSTVHSRSIKRFRAGKSLLSWTIFTQLMHKNTTTMLIACQYIYLIHRNLFTVAYIIILRILVQKSTCHKGAISRTLLTKWPLLLPNRNRSH